MAARSVGGEVETKQKGLRQVLAMGGSLSVILLFCLNYSMIFLFT